MEHLNFAFLLVYEINKFNLTRLVLAEIVSKRLLGWWKKKCWQVQLLKGQKVIWDPARKAQGTFRIFPACFPATEQLSQPSLMFPRISRKLTPATPLGSSFEWPFQMHQAPSFLKTVEKMLLTSQGTWKMVLPSVLEVKGWNFFSRSHKVNRCQEGVIKDFPVCLCVLGPFLFPVCPGFLISSKRLPWFSMLARGGPVWKNDLDIQSPWVQRTAAFYSPFCGDLQCIIDESLWKVLL